MRLYVVPGVCARGSSNIRLNGLGLRQVKEKKFGCRPCSVYDALLGVPGLAVDGKSCSQLRLVSMHAETILVVIN